MSATWKARWRNSKTPLLACIALLLADLNSHHFITTLLNVGNLIGAIFGSVVNRRAGNQRGMPHGQSTGKEIVHAVVLILAAGDQVVGLVPGIDGRSDEGSGRVRCRTGERSSPSTAATPAAAWHRRSGFHTVGRINNRVLPRGIDRTGGQRLQSVGWK